MTMASSVSTLDEGSEFPRAGMSDDKERAALVPMVPLKKSRRERFFDMSGTLTSHNFFLSIC